MSMWTEAAKSALERELALVQANVAQSGADPVEVAEDVRRHVEEEVVVRRLEVVTAEDVERLVRELGWPGGPAPAGPPPARSAESAGPTAPIVSPEVVRAGHDSAAGAGTPAATGKPPFRWFLLFFGVLLPFCTLGIELVTRMCSSTFFNPVPDLWHGLLAGMVPLINLWAWWSLRTGAGRAGGWGWALVFGQGFSMVAAGYFSIQFLPLSPFAVIAVVLFGWGLLPLSPMLALGAAVRLRVLLRREESASGSGPAAIGGLACGLIAGAIAVGALAAPPIVTRHLAARAVEADGAERSQAVRWLRRVGSEEVLLADCYGVGSWARGNPFGLYTSGRPVPAQEARQLFYRVTGRPFNEFPPPQSGAWLRGWDRLDEWDWDGDQGGTVVGGRLRGLSLSQSRLDGLVDAEAGWAYTEWVMEFRNVSRQDREARAQLLLPPGGVVSRVTLWVNGEEREAAFAGQAEVRAAYEKVVKVYRRDPILVTHVGGGRVLMQCFPVPPNGGTMKVRVGITAPLELADASQAVWRWPQFAERNFGLGPGLEHSVWLEAGQALSAAQPGLAQEQVRPGVFGLRGRLRDEALGETASLVRLPRTASNRSAWVADPHSTSGDWVRQNLVDRALPRPGRAVIVVDGSLATGQLLPVVSAALEKLPDGVECALVWAGDEVETFPADGKARPMDAALRRDWRERLAQAQCVGGQDNIPALVRAWDLAVGRPDSVILWLHGSQPVEMSSDEQLNQRLLWRRRPEGGAGPRVLSMPVAPGPNRLIEPLARLVPVASVPRLGSFQEDLERELARWSGAAREWGWERVRVPGTDTAQPEATRGRKGSKHLARLWAHDEVLRRVEQGDRAGAVAVAARFQLVTPVSGAVVLETRQQFEQAGLQPVAADTVPTVPEPGALALGLVALGWVVIRSAWRRWRGAHRTAASGPSGAGGDSGAA